MWTEQSLQQAIKEESFFLRFLPQMDLRTNEIVGAQVLIFQKWANGGITTPKSLLPELDKYGLTIYLDLWVFQAICKLQKKRQVAGLKILPITMPLSVWSAATPYHVYDLAMILRDSEIPTGSICVALSGAFSCSPLYGMRKSLSHLHSHGVSLALSNFGTDAVTLALFYGIPFDRLILSGSFLTRSMEDPRVFDILKQVNNFSAALNLDLYYDEISSSEMANFLDNFENCYGQGLALMPHMSPTEFFNLIDNVS